METLPAAVAQDGIPKIAVQATSAAGNGTGHHVATLAAVAGERHVVNSVDYGFVDPPATVQTLVITDETTTITVPVSVNGHSTLMFPVPFPFAENTKVTVTLSNDGASVGYVNVHYQ